MYIIFQKQLSSHLEACQSHTTLSILFNNESHPCRRLNTSCWSILHRLFSANSPNQTNNLPRKKITFVGSPGLTLRKQQRPQNSSITNEIKLSIYTSRRSYHFGHQLSQRRWYETWSKSESSYIPLHGWLTDRWGTNDSLILAHYKNQRYFFISILFIFKLSLVKILFLAANQ